MASLTTKFPNMYQLYRVYEIQESKPENKIKLETYHWRWKGQKNKASFVIFMFSWRK